MNPPTTRRRPRQARSRDTVAAIVTAARDLLADEGPEAFNTNRIATEAGVGVGSVYEYFPNKEAVALAVIAQVSEEETDAVLRRIRDDADLGLPERIAVVVDLVVGLYWRNHELYRSLWSMTAVARTVGSRPGEQEIVRAVRDLLEPSRDLLAVDDLDLAVFCCFHVVEALASRFAESGRRWSRATAAAEITAVVGRYLLAGADDVADASDVADPGGKVPPARGKERA